MAFGEPKFNLPKAEDKKEKKYTEKDAKKISRRSFLKGALSTGTIGIISHVEKKGDRIKTALDTIKKLFQSPKEKLRKNNNGNTNSNNERQNNQENKIEIRGIADYYLKAFEELKMKEEFFPKKIFTRDLLIAQQLQESKYKANAKSHAGAVGTMQNMDISIKDVSQFLEILDQNHIIEYQGPIYLNPKLNPEKKEAKRKKFGKRILKQSDFIALELLRMDNPDYSRALGKLYLMRLSNVRYGYGAGQTQYQKGDIRGAQTEILGAYNAGISRVKGIPPEKWKYKEPVEYTKKIFNYMERLKNIRNAMEQIGLDKNNDSIAMRTAREMDKVRGHGKTRKELLNKTMYYIINSLQKMQDKKGEELTGDEIIAFFATLNNTKTITQKLFYNQK